MEQLEIRVDALGDMLKHVYGIYTTVCREDLQILKTSAPNPAVLQALIRVDGEARQLPEGQSPEPGRQYMYANDLGMLWILEPGQSRSYLLGPVVTDRQSPDRIYPQLRRQGLSDSAKAVFLEFSRQIPMVSVHRLQQCGRMLHSCLTGEPLAMEALEILGSVPEPEPTGEFRSRSTDYLLEQELWKTIREGNLQRNRKLERSIANVSVGDMGSGRYLRQEKNQAVVMTALGCRAAVEGGLSPDVAYALSDRYIQRVEDCTTLTEVTALTGRILEDYTRRVRAVRSRKLSSQVGDCWDYISLHPEQVQELSHLAARYGYTPYYFSRKFRQETGISLRDYVAAQKVEKAKELLTTTTMSLGDIGEYLGFHSQSYFGNLFKSITGTTPGAYRAGYKEET